MNSLLLYDKYHSIYALLRCIFDLVDLAPENKSTMLYARKNKMMKLEQAIQQAEFTSDNQRITLNFMFTYNWFKEEQKNFFKPYDITSQQFNVLRILRGRYPEPYTTSQVRDRMLDKMSDASRIVDRLVKKGLVMRSVTKADKRLVDVVISRKGLALLDKIDGPLEDFMAAAFNNLTINEKNLFNDMLERIREN